MAYNSFSSWEDIYPKKTGDKTCLIKKNDHIQVNIELELGRFAVYTSHKVKGDYIGAEHWKYMLDVTKSFYNLNEAIIYAEECFLIAEKASQYNENPKTYLARQIAELRQRDGLNGWDILVDK